MKLEINGVGGIEGDERSRRSVEIDSLLLEGAPAFSRNGLKRAVSVVGRQGEAT